MTRQACPLMLWLCLICGAWSSSSAFAGGALPEYLLKTGFLYNFAILTNWPPNALGDNFELCFIGGQDFGPALESLRGKEINDRQVNFRYIDSTDEATACNMLFIAKREYLSISRLMQKIAMEPVMTVTDDENLANEGVTILLRPEEKRLVFEVYLDAAEKARLKFSSRLLRLSRTVGK